MFRNLNINYFIYRKFDEIFLGFEKFIFESGIVHTYHRSKLTLSNCKYFKPIVHANTLCKNKYIITTRVLKIILYLSVRGKHKSTSPCFRNWR